MYGVDVNPFAIERVKEKIEREGIKNVKAVLADASRTGLPHESVDLTLSQSLFRALGNKED